MVTIKDGCGCDPCGCDWKQKLKEAYSRAIQSVNKIGDNDGSVYFPDGTGFVKLPLPRQSDVAQIKTNTQDIADLKVQDVQLQANITAETTAREAAITAEETARKAKDDLLDADITRIDNTDAGQDQRIQDNTDRITSTYNDLVSTEATVATHDSEIITLKADNQALAKSLVSGVNMTDGTTAGSVQVSIEREDGALITSANYKWGRDIGVRLEAGTQAGYIKTVISLSDGTVLESNEYKIVEVLESDVYVTAITLVPDMTAGTIGGNISYSNGTTQTINTINVPTAPGVTSAIEALQSRMTAVEQKNTTQDSQISAIDARVKAIEDTPGVGQFGAGKLGTIAGSTADGKVAAEDDGTGSVNGWNALKQRVTTAEGQIVTAQNDISALNGTVSQQTTDISGLMTDVTNLQNKNTAQDQSIAANTSAIAANASAIEGKVSIDQGVANAGKALVVGTDGNVSLAENASTIPNVTPNLITSGFPCNINVSYNEDTDLNSSSFYVTTLDYSSQSLPVIMNYDKLGLIDSLTLASHTNYGTYYSKTYKSGAIFDQIVSIFSNYYIVHYQATTFGTLTPNTTVVIVLTDSNIKGAVQARGTITNDMKLNVTSVIVISSEPNISITELLYSTDSSIVNNANFISESPILDIKYLSYT